MKETKFRAWDKEVKFMISWNQLLKAYDLHTLLKSKDKRFVVIQYSGIKDKNNNEIYEAYIVKITTWWFGRKSTIAEVVFENGAFKAAGELLSNWQDVEVIGNKFEDKNLLKGANIK